MATEWTDELRQEVIERYKKEDPTPETSSEIVEQISSDEKFSFTTVNGIRAILSKAGVYISKASAAKAGKPGDTAAKGTRVNKQTAITGLVDTLNSNSLPVDEDIISKLTGKAAMYFTTVIKELVDKE